jgi:hypothetical protein
MTEKPDWFKISEADQKPSELAPRPKNHLFRIAAVAVPLVLVGAIAVGANGEAEEENAPPIDTTLTTSSNTSTTSGLTTATTSNKSSAGTVATSVQTKTSTVVGVANPASANSKNGKGFGVPMPTGKGGDDGREGHIKSENHESGEHSFGDDD